VKQVTKKLGNYIVVIIEPYVDRKIIGSRESESQLPPSDQVRGELSLDRALDPRLKPYRRQ
jgi:hypothetical protein